MKIPKFLNIGGFVKKFLQGSRSLIRSLKFANVGNPEVYEHIDVEKAITEGYNGNTAVYAIVNKDAQKFGYIPQFVYKKGDDGEKLENELSALLDRPNSYEGRSAFRERLRTYFKVTGEAFIWLNRGMMADDVFDPATGRYEPRPAKERMKMKVLEMHILPSDHVNILPDKEDIFGITRYQFEVAGEKKYIPVEDMIHWKNTSLQFDGVTRNHMRGQPALSAGYKTLQQNNSATDAAVRMYQNDGAKGILHNEDMANLDLVQKQSIDGVVQRKINSNDIKGAVATLPGKWGYLDLGKGSTDLCLLEGKKISMQELCFLFDVPYELFDPATTFANKEQAQKGWLNNSIIPACKSFDAELNRMLLIAFGVENAAEIRSDFDDLPEMREDMAKLVQALAGAWWTSGNEKREWMGFDPDPDPLMNEVMVPQGLTPISMAGESMDDVQRRLDEQGLND